jgi:hypothetical protein
MEFHMKNIEILAPIFTAALLSDDLATDVVQRMSRAIGYADIKPESFSVKRDNCEADDLFCGYSDQGYALVRALNNLLDCSEEGETFSEMLAGGEADFTVDVEFDSGIKYFSINSGLYIGTHTTAMFAAKPDLAWLN